MIVNNLLLKLKNRDVANIKQTQQALLSMNAYLSQPTHLKVARFIGNVLDTQASVCYEI